MAPGNQEQKIIRVRVFKTRTGQCVGHAMHLVMFMAHSKNETVERGWLVIIITIRRVCACVCTCVCLYVCVRARVRACE